MRQGKLLGRRRLDLWPSRSLTTSPRRPQALVRSARIFIACPVEDACRDACYMQMGERICTCSRHINRSSQPGRPSQAKTSKKSGQGQGAWSFARRGRFKIAAKVGRFPQRRSGPSWALASIGWLWMAPALLLPAIALLLLVLDGSRWLPFLLVWCLRQDGRKGSASNGASAGANGRPSDGLGWARSIPEGGATAGDGMAEPP